MGEAAFAPGTPEEELGRVEGQPVMLPGERGSKMGRIALTHDRILFGHEKYISTTGNHLGDLIASGLNEATKPGGPVAVVELAQVRAGRRIRRRMLPDLYGLKLADGSEVRFGRVVQKKFDATIRRLMTERHGLTVTEAGDGCTAE